MDRKPTWQPPGTEQVAVFDSAHRRIVPEVMDQPGLEPSLHRQALSALRRVNWLSRTADTLWPSVRTLGPSPVSTDEVRPISLLDVACGGGEVASRLLRLANSAGLSLQVSGCDVSAEAVRFAREHNPNFSDRGPRFFVHDILREPLANQYDVVTCTLFLHHLDSSQAELLFDRLAAAARRMVLISDLRRTRLGFWMAHLASRLLTRSPVVRVDGPLSVAAALSLQEVESLARRCGWSECRIQRVWPERFLLIWNKS